MLRSPHLKVRPAFKCRGRQSPLVIPRLRGLNSHAPRIIFGTARKIQINVGFKQQLMILEKELYPGLEPSIVLKVASTLLARFPCGGALTRVTIFWAHVL